MAAFVLFSGDLTFSNAGKRPLLAFANNERHRRGVFGGHRSRRQLRRGVQARSARRNPTSVIRESCPRYDEQVSAGGTGHYAEIAEPPH
jgi:hypothetical protein